MYKRTTQEVHSLKERLAERQEYARRSRASEEVMRDQMLEAKSKVDEERVMKRELTYGKWICTALSGSGLVTCSGHSNWSCMKTVEMK